MIDVTKWSLLTSRQSTKATVQNRIQKSKDECPNRVRKRRVKAIKKDNTGIRSHTQNRPNWAGRQSHASENGKIHITICIGSFVFGCMAVNKKKGGVIMSGATQVN